MMFYANVSKVSGIDWHTIRKNYSLQQMIAMVQAYNKLYEEAEKQIKIPNYQKNYRQKLNTLRKAHAGTGR